MEPSLSILERIRIEKAAADCGFDLAPEGRGSELRLRSSQFPETVDVRLAPTGGFELLLSDAFLLRDVPSTVGCWVEAIDVSALYQELERVAAAARTKPNRVAQQFAQATQAMPMSTEAERLVVQRVGQNLFRNALLDYWRGRCCVTGLAMPSLLRASHIKPWARCQSDDERLNVFNGLLLAPNLDALFDDGWVSFHEDGAIAVSATLPASARHVLGISPDLRIPRLTATHEGFLRFHRTEVFRG